MCEKIVGFIACFMCALPFFIISTYNKGSKEPITFGSGDTSLKSKVRNIREYNIEMSMLYRKCAMAFLITGSVFFIAPMAGILMICFDCTLGIYIVYHKYKKILNIYS